MKKRLQKKSEVLREGYVKGLRKAQSIINEMLEEMEELEDVELPNEMQVIADYDDWAVWVAECEKQCDIESWDDITYEDEDGITWATITGIVWGEKWKR